MDDADEALLYARQGNREGEVKPAAIWTMAFSATGHGEWVAVLRLASEVISAERHAFKHDASRDVMNWVQFGVRGNTR